MAAAGEVEAAAEDHRGHLQHSALGAAAAVVVAVQPSAAAPLMLAEAAAVEGWAAHGGTVLHCRIRRTPATTTLWEAAAADTHTTDHRSPWWRLSARRPCLLETALEGVV